MPYEHQDFERAQLYDEIWSEPVSKVSKQYGISDNGLRKICRNLGVPIPPIGYWAKLAAGKTVKKPPLGKSEGPTTYRRSVWKDPQAGEFEQRARARVEADAADAPVIPEITMRTSVDECLPLVKRIAKKLGGKSRDSRDWPICEDPELMRVSVSVQNSQRATLVLNLLLETLVAAGYSLRAGNKETPETYVRILDGKIAFRIRERSVQEAIPLTTEQRAENERLKYNRHRQEYKYHPTNEIEIAAVEPSSNYARATIADTRTTTIESKIVLFIGRLREMVIREAVQAEMAAEQRVIDEARAAERRRLAEIRRVELERLKQVEEWAAKLERANRLRILANEFETKKLRSSDDAVDAVWIRRAADWLDPTVKRAWEDVDNAPSYPGGL